MDKTAIVFNDTLLLTGEARSAFATFGYALMTGEIDLTGKLAQNQIDALVNAYNQAFWGV